MKLTAHRCDLHDNDCEVEDALKGASPAYAETGRFSVRPSELTLNVTVFSHHRSTLPGLPMCLPRVDLIRIHLASTAISSVVFVVTK